MVVGVSLNRDSGELRKYLKAIIESLIHHRPLQVDNITSKLVSLAKKNKILYELGLIDKRLQSTWEWRELDLRHKKHMETLEIIARASIETSARIIVFKTFKSFNYVPDDIDILVLDKRSIDRVIEYFRRHGYSIHKPGTPEITIRKVVDGTFVDIDVHRVVAAGTYEYIDSSVLWLSRNKLYINDLFIYTPSIEVDLVLCAGHSVLKELFILLSDLYHIYMLSRNRPDVVLRAIELSRYLGLYNALMIQLKLVYRIFYMRSLDAILPYRIPYIHIVKSYHENILYRLKYNGLKTIKELLLIPGSKGFKIAFKHLRGSLL